MFASTGEGDVVVSPGVDEDGHALTYVELSSPDGVAVLRARSAIVAGFLRQTEQLVPIGQSPHWMMFPQPSPMGPQVAPNWAQVLGVQRGR